MANRITTLFDFKEQGGGLKKIKADIQAADGATGKFKAGWQGAMSSVKAYGAEAALAVGTTLVAAGVKAGQEFANAAIEVGRFSDATGLSTEQASRWVSVADDLQLNAEDVEKAFLRLNKEIGEGDGVAEEYGLELKRTADGAADVNGTMLETIKVINGIKDPTERARVAQELFGRSYANVAEIIFNDAEKVQAQLESTSESQIFDEDEIQKARDYRAAMDQLGDVLVDLKYTIGEGVVPVLTESATQLAEISQIINELPEPPGWMTKSVNIARPFVDPLYAVRKLGDAIGLTRDKAEAYDETLTLTDEETQRSIDILNNQRLGLDGVAGSLANLDANRAASNKVTEEAIRAQEREYQALRDSAREATYNADAHEEMGRVQRITTDFVNKAREAQEKFLQSIKHTRDEVGKLRRELDDQQSWIGFQDAWDDINATLADSETSSRDAYAALLDQKELVLDYAEAIDLPDAVITNMIALIDQGKQAEVYAFMERMQNGVTMPIKPVVINTGRGTKVRVDEHGNVHHGATGGIVTQPTLSVIGEAGPEAVVPLNKAPGASPLPASFGGGSAPVFHINVSAPYGASPDDFGRRVMEAIRRESRWRGPI